jgi:hypothetical protein
MAGSYSFPPIFPKSEPIDVDEPFLPQQSVNASSYFIGSTNSYLSEIEKQIEYHQKHLRYFKELHAVVRTKGLDSAVSFELVNSKQLPKKPQLFSLKRKLERSTSVSNLSETPLEKKKKGLELLNALPSFLLKEEVFITSPIDVPQIPTFNYLEINIEKIRDIIVKGEQVVQYRGTHCLVESVQFGLWLEHLYELNKGHFHDFVSSNLSYEIRWINKIRQMAKLFNTYTKLQQLNIGLTRAVNITAELKKAFAEDPYTALKWI